MNQQNTKVLKIFLIIISVVTVISIAVAIATDKPPASSSPVHNEETVSNTVPPTTEPQEIGLYTFANPEQNTVLVQIEAYNKSRIRTDSKYSSRYSSNNFDNPRGIMFRNNIVQFVRDIKSENNYDESSVFSYQLYSNERLTFLGMDEYNNDFIIVERIYLDNAIIFKCRECGDEMWYVLASDIDFSSRKIEEETNEYGSKEYSLWYNLK